MPNGLPQTLPDPASVSLVLYGHANAAQAEAAVREAERVLAALGRDYEILLVSEAGAGAASLPAAQPGGRDGVVALNGSPTFAGAVKAGLAAARCTTLALARAGSDLSALAYLLPLAEGQAVAWDARPAAAGSLVGRVLGWGYTALARTLLGTRVRLGAGDGGIALLRRESLPDIVPESEGLFAQAELLARARQHGLPVAEVTRTRVAGPRPARARGLATALAELVRFWWSHVQFPAGAPIAAPLAAWGFGLILAVLGALLLFTDLNHPLLDPDEGRQAEVPREMLAHHDLLLPRMLGEPYYDKPPLQYWLTAGAYTVFGLRPWVARLVPALAAWLTLLLAYAWGQRSLGVRAAFLGGIGLCLTPGFVVLGRTVILDSLLTACVAASWYAAHTAVSRPAFRWPWWLAAAVVCGLGILAKGPVALVLAVPPVFAYTLLTPAAARPRWPAWAAYLGLALAVAAPWYVAMALREPEYLEHFFWKANVLRFVNPYDHEHAWWYYLPVLCGFTFPWSLFWPALGYFVLSRGAGVARLRSHGLGFCALSLVWCLAFYSLSGCKSPPYVAPVLIPLALIFGAFADGVLFHAAAAQGPAWEWARQRLPRRVASLMLILSAGCALATAVLGWQNWGPALVQLVSALAAAGVWWHYGWRTSPLAAWGACAAGSLMFNLFAVQDLSSGFAGRHSPATMARIVRRRPGADCLPVLTYARQWPSASFYLRRDMVPFCGEGQPQVILDFARLCPEVSVLVESGPPLRELLDNLPQTLETEVVRPRRQGQVALVIVRQRGH